MSRSNYSLIESGKSDPTLKTLERIAELTNSTLVIDLIPNELEQVELQNRRREAMIVVNIFNENCCLFFLKAVY